MDKHSRTTKWRRRRDASLSPNLVGKRFHALTVMADSGAENRLRQVMWDCKCDCGKLIIASAFSLRAGIHKSCGCGTNGCVTDVRTRKTVGELTGNHWERILRSAKRRGINVNVSQEEAWGLYLVQQGKCALTGKNILFSSEPGKQTASLDRIDSKTEYVLGNLQWVHKDLQCMKMALPQARFIELCVEVAAHNKVAEQSISLTE